MSRKGLTDNDIATLPLPGEEATTMILLATAIASLERAAMVDYICSYA